MERDSVQGEAMRKLMKIEGRAIEDDLLVSILLKRIQMKDCQTNGFILEDFPKTRTQAMYLAKRGLVPTNVFYLRMEIDQVYRRSNNTSIHF